MITFLRQVIPLLDPGVRRRFYLGAIGSLVIAGLETLGVLLILPLTQLLTNPKGVSAHFQWLTGPVPVQHPGTTVVTVASLVVIAFVVKGVLSILYQRWTTGFLLDNDAALTVRLLRAFLDAPYSLLFQRNSAELQRTLQYSVYQVFVDTLNNVMAALADVAIIVLVSIVLIGVSPVAAIFGGICFGFVGIGYQRFIHRRAASAGHELHEARRQAPQIIQQSLAAIREVKLGQRQDYFAEQLRLARKRMASGLRTTIILVYLPRYYLETALVIAIAVLAALLFATQPQADALAVLSLFMAAGFRILPSLNRVLVCQSTCRSAHAAVVQVKADLDLARSTLRTPARVTAFTEPLPVVLEGVSFSYPHRDEATLSTVSMTIAAGERVGIAGLSGAGKSTLVDLILGLLDPDAGSIAVGGRPLATVRSEWQQSIGYVPQKVALLDATLRDNVAFGVAPESVSESRIHSALEAAGLGAFAAGLPQGLDTVVGEDGIRLSGGERQRVAIARALYGEPHTLILDEATSALDAATEDHIMETIRSLPRSITVIIVAHRLSTLRDATRIYMLSHGSIVGSGSFADLSRSNAEFQHMVTLSRLPEAASPDIDSGET